MGLRVRLLDKAVEGVTLTVRYEIAYADATGTEVWKAQHELVYTEPVSAETVVNHITADAEAKAKSIEASVGLDIHLGKTYERQADGNWKVVNVGDAV